MPAPDRTTSHEPVERLLFVNAEHRVCGPLRAREGKSGSLRGICGRGRLGRHTLSQAEALLVLVHELSEGPDPAKSVSEGQCRNAGALLLDLSAGHDRRRCLFKPGAQLELLPSQPTFSVLYLSYALRKTRSASPAAPASQAPCTETGRALYGSEQRATDRKRHRQLQAEALGGSLYAPVPECKQRPRKKLPSAALLLSLSLFSEAGQRIATDQLVQDHDHHESILLSGQGAVGGGLGRVKYRMLHIPGIVNFTYHLHVSMSVLKVLA